MELKPQALAIPKLRAACQPLDLDHKSEGHDRRQYCQLKHNTRSQLVLTSLKPRRAVVDSAVNSDGSECGDGRAVAHSSAVAGHAQCGQLCSTRAHVSPPPCFAVYLLRKLSGWSKAECHRALPGPHAWLCLHMHHQREQKRCRLATASLGNAKDIPT